MARSVAALTRQAFWRKAAKNEGFKVLEHFYAKSVRLIQQGFD